MIFNFEELIRGSQTDSRKLNDYFRAVQDDLGELYTSFARISSDLSAQVDAAGATNDAIISQIESLQATLSGVTTTQTYVSLFDADNVLFPDVDDIQKATHDVAYGAATLYMMDQHREFLHLDPDSGTYVLSDDAEKYIDYYITNNKFLPKIDRIIENDVTRMIDPNPATAFITKVFTANPDIDDIEQIFTITMESQKDVNLIKVIPVPELGIDISSIELDSPGGGYAFPRKIDSTDYVFPEVNSRRKIMPIYPSLARGVRLGIKQRMKTSTIPYQFLLGVRHISIESNKYSNLSYVCLKFEVPSGKTGFSELVPNWIVDSNTILSVYIDEDDMKAVNNSYIYRSDATPLLPAEPIIFGSGVPYIYLLFKLQTPSGIDSTPIIFGSKVRWV